MQVRCIESVQPYYNEFAAIVNQEAMKARKRGMDGTCAGGTAMVYICLKRWE
jgi:hypothetical protein